MTLGSRAAVALTDAGISVTLLPGTGPQHHCRGQSAARERGHPRLPPPGGACLARGLVFVRDQQTGGALMMDLAPTATHVRPGRRSSPAAGTAYPGRSAGCHLGADLEQAPRAAQRTGLMVATVALTVGLVVVVLGTRLLGHAIDPKSFSPAGSQSVFSDLSSVMAELGFIVAVALGATAGTSDLTEGMFRHLVITGRSRTALYLARLPAGLSILVPLVAVAFTMLCLVTAYRSAGPSALTATGTIRVGLWLELDIAIGFVVAVGLGALMGQRTLPIILLVILEVIVTPIVTGHVIPSFINGQRLVVGVAMAQLRPASLGAGAGRGPSPGGAALQVPRCHRAP